VKSVKCDTEQHRTQKAVGEQRAKKDERGIISRVYNSLAIPSDMSPKML